MHIYQPLCKKKIICKKHRSPIKNKYNLSPKSKTRKKKHGANRKEKNTGKPAKQLEDRTTCCSLHFIVQMIGIKRLSIIVWKYAIFRTCSIGDWLSSSTKWTLRGDRSLRVPTVDNCSLSIIFLNIPHTKWLDTTLS